jgi:hypothetical protein
MRCGYVASARSCIFPKRVVVQVLVVVLRLFNAPEPTASRPAWRNILFVAHCRPALSDFGLSRVIQDGGKGLHTATVRLQVPIRWMAPEVPSGQPRYFYASDVWTMDVGVWQRC